MTDETGQIDESYEYDVFGEIKNSKESYKTDFLYTGRRYDSETGLYYYRARMYDALTGRFTTEDPVGVQAGINFYVYVKNEAFNSNDYSGLLKSGFGSALKRVACAVVRGVVMAVCSAACMRAIMMLFLYNVMFILPLAGVLIFTVIIGNSLKVVSLSRKNLIVGKITLAVVFLCVGVLILIV